MSINHQVKSLTEDIEASYETRIAAVSDLVKETHQTLGNFHREHEKMASDQKRSLASNRSGRARQVQKMRAGNAEDSRDTARAFAAFLSASEKERMKGFATLMREIKGAVADIEKDTAKTLADFRSDHQEMASSLRSELSCFQRELSKMVGDMLAGFSADHRQAHTHWEHLNNVMAAKRAGRLIGGGRNELVPTPKAKMGVNTADKGTGSKK